MKRGRAGMNFQRLRLAPSLAWPEAICVFKQGRERAGFRDDSEGLEGGRRGERRSSFGREAKEGAVVVAIASWFRDQDLGDEKTRSASESVSFEPISYQIPVNFQV